VELRKRYIKLLRIGSEKRAMYLVAQAVKGMLAAWTLVPLDDMRRLNRQRQGRLLWVKQ
jgi:hypothetical protein